MDDFGTGFTSLSNLQLFPFDFVKIERPFVNLDNSDQANTGMMAAMVQMAGSLKLTAIAEIIESEAAATALQQMGCELWSGLLLQRAHRSRGGPASIEQSGTVSATRNFRTAGCTDIAGELICHPNRTAARGFIAHRDYRRY